MKFNPVTYNKKEIRVIYSIANAKDFLYKAPNGEQSNLSKAMWLLTRARSFRSWFGDWINVETNKLTKKGSKVVDKNGEPLIVEHVGQDKITMFDSKFLNDIGFHFGDSNTTKSLKKERSWWDDNHAEKYFLKANNVIEIVDPGKWGFNLFNQLIINYYKLSQHEVLNLRNEYSTEAEKVEIDKSISFHFGNSESSYGLELFKLLRKNILNKIVIGKNIKRFLKLFAKYLYEEHDGNSLITKKEIHDGFKIELNIDCFKYKNLHEGNNSYSYMMFDPKDIKSIYNKGSFNKNNEYVYENKHIHYFNKWSKLSRK